MFRNRLFVFIFFFICVGTLFLCSSHFVNAQTTPKWYCLYVGIPALIGLPFAFKNHKEPHKSLYDNQLLSFVVPVCCFVQGIYGIGQFLGWFQSSNGFRVTGSFENPAGFAACLCAGAPFFWYFILDKNPIKKWLAIIAMTIVGATVFLSASRTGIISFLSVLLLVGSRYLPLSKNKKLMLLAIILFALIIALYFIKKDSADGRMLIWQCSWEMFKDKPIFGYGYGGFRANYMNYQANYFVSHPDSQFVMLAGNVGTPFNEYIALLVNYGLFGLTVLLTLTILLWRTYRKRPNQSILTIIACWCLASIAIFALFSYPLTYPFVWVMGLTAIFIIMHPKLPSQRIYNWSKPVVFLLILTVYYFSYTDMYAEMQWRNIANKSMLGQTEKMLPKYKSLYNQLHKNRLFLYNYAVELKVAGYYSESLRIAGECEKLWADYELQMLIAENYRLCEQYKQAEDHYRKASLMCPVKFTPLYCLYQLYGITGDKENELIMAKTILYKPVKVMSPAIQQIKQEVKQNLNPFCTPSSHKHL